MTRQFRKATIKDVASKAGVSITTVSMFVSGREEVCSQETAVRIRAAVSDLNYVPNPVIRGLQKRETRTLGICMYSPVEPIAYGNIFFERLWRGVFHEADTAQYALLRYPSTIMNGASANALLDGRADGILYHSHSEAAGDERPARLAAAGMPIVLLTRSLAIPEGCGAAYANEADTVKLALSHLWQHGHRRIAHIAGPIPSESIDRFTNVDDIATSRLQAYQAWMHERNAGEYTRVGYGHGWMGNHVGDIIADWYALPDRPTAIFCANDALAIATLHAARALGWAVPEALSVIGVDNTGPAIENELTTVEPPDENVGRASVRALVLMLQGAPLPECRIAVPVTRLVSRGTVSSVHP